MRVIVADDEPLALGKMQASLACIPSVEVVGCARNGVEALAMIRSLKPDLVILDIEMPGRSGLSVIENLRVGEAIPEVIFSTAFAHYAVKAFEVNAVDYLTKPVSFERLRDAVRNAGERLAARTANQRFAELQALISALQAEAGNDGQVYEQELWIRRKEGLERLPVKDIDLIEAQGDYVNLHVGDEMHLVRDTVSSLEPFANLTTIRAETDAFSETGGTGALTAEANTDDLTISTLGVRFGTGRIGGLSLWGSAGWRNVSGDRDPDGRHAFGGGSTFTVLGALQSEQAAVMDLEAQWRLAPNVTLGIAYDGIMGTEGEDHAVRGSFRMAF